VVSPSAASALVLSGFLNLMLDRGAKWAGCGASIPGGTSTPRPGRQLASPPGVSPDSHPAPGGSASDGMIVSTFVTSGNPDIVKYTYCRKTLTWISGPQLFPSREDSIAESLGFTWGESAPKEADFLADERDPADRALLWLRLFQRLSDWWREIDGGPFAPTASGLAMSYVRKRITPKSILSHQEPAVRSLEEAALFGGRASTWFYGPVAPSWTAAADRPELGAGRPWPVALGPADHYDVSSMYPTILATERFPTRYLYPYDAPSLAAVEDMLERWLVIASVKLQADEPEYPVRRGNRITYPTGVFNTYLTTPELQEALRRGHVLKVYRAVTYAAGRPFEVPMRSLLALRADAAKAKDKVQETFIKLISNSFGGRIAMRQYQWKRRPDVAPYVEWGEWPHRDPLTGVVHHYRSRSGLVDEKVTAETPVRPLAACYAHLTAYGRDLMRRIRESLPPRSVVSQDTDGIWVLRHVRGRRVTVRPRPESPAYRVRQDKTATLGRWYGPRHYWTDRGWVLSGLHDPRPTPEGTGFYYSYTNTPVNTGTNLPPVWVYELDKYAPLCDVPTDGTVGEDGWVTAPLATWD